MKGLILFVMMVSSLFALKAQAEEWTLSPSDKASSAVLAGSPTALPEPEEESISSEGGRGEAPRTTAQAFLKFDLTPVIEADRGVHIVGLEWRFEGMPSDTVSSFYLYVVSSPAAVATESEGVPNTTEEDVMGFWELSPMGYIRNGGGIVLFDLTDLVREWVRGTRPNSGIVIKTRDVEESQLRSQLANARLVVR